jgi:CRISPR-associated Csx10 family RAMP protein
MNRVTLNIEITAKAPLLLGGKKSKGTQTEPPMKYIPGRVLRGALAESILRGREHSVEICSAECDFCTIFSSDNKAIFRNAYPSSRDAPTSRPIPISVFGCKTHPTEHVVVDTLPKLLVANLRGYPAFFSCFEPGCGERIEKKSGFLKRDSSVLKTVQSSTEREVVRVGIDRARRTAADEILYNLAVLAEGTKELDTEGGDDIYRPTTFRGQLVCPAHLEQQVKELFARHVKHLGGSVSRGLGNVNISVEPAPERASVRERVLKWNRYLADCLEADTTPQILSLGARWARIADERLVEKLRDGSSGFVTIDLMSDAVLSECVEVGGKLVPSETQGFVLTENILKYETGCASKVELLLSLATPGSRSGWNLMWGTPREVKLVARAGSVFVYWVESLSDWYDPLEKLERTGIGEDVDQGFGEVEVCSPEHLQMQNLRRGGN